MFGIIKYLILVTYVFPMVVSIIYILIQKAADNIHRTNLSRIFKDNKQLAQCLVISATPFINFIPFLVCIKLFLKSIKLKLLK